MTKIWIVSNGSVILLLPEGDRSLILRLAALSYGHIVEGFGAPERVTVAWDFGELAQLAQILHH